MAHAGAAFGNAHRQDLGIAASSRRLATITSTTSGATICYTTNGTTPAATTPGTCSTGTTLANGGAVTVSASETLAAIATESGFTNSAVGSATAPGGTATVPVTTTGTMLKAIAAASGQNSALGSASYTLVTAAPSFSPVPGTYTTAQQVTISDNTPGATIYYTTPIPGLVAAYAFDEGAAATVADASGNANMGTILNATWTSAGKYGSALEFNGTNSWVMINDSPSLDLATGMTLEAWVYPYVIPPVGCTSTNCSWMDVVYKDVDRYYIEASSNQNQEPEAGGIFVDGKHIVFSPSALPINTWTHLALTFDSAMIRLYVNGLMVANASETNPLTTSTDPLFIGGDSTMGQYMNGRIDEVRVYNVAVTQAQIQGDMNTSAIPTPQTTAPGGTATVVVNNTFTISARATAPGFLDSPVTSGTYTIGATTPSFVQAAAATPQSSLLTVSVTYPAAQAAGDLNVVLVGWNDTTSSVTSVTDSQGNSYSLAIGPTRGTGLSQSIYYAPNIKAGSNTVTVTFNQAAASVDLRVLEYRGVSTLDVTAGASGNSGTSNSGSATTTVASELIFGANTVFTTTSGAGSGFVSRIITQPDGDIAEDRTVSATGSYSATAPLSSGFWVMQIATFK